MNIALAQIATRLGEVEANVDLHLDVLEKARKKKAGLVVFPELCLTGYTLKDLVDEVALDPAKDPRFRKVVAATKGLSAVVGFVEESPNEKGLFYNAAAFIAGGRILHVHRKVYLPTNGMFEEAKFFAQGREFRTFAAPWGRIGLLICRDFLHYGASYVHYASGADIIICISLLLAGAPGKRYALPNARVLLHQPHGGAQGQAVDIEIQAREIVRLRELLDAIIARHTGQPLERVGKDTDRDFILTADEALEYGVVDEIISGRGITAEVAAPSPNGA